MARLLPLAAALALLLPVGLATHQPMGRCDADGHPALGIVEVTGGTPGTTFYLDDRNLAFGNGVWHYVETNGIWTGRGPGAFRDDVAAHNLQRGGASPFLPDDPEVCVDDPLVLPDAPFPLV